LHGFKKRKRRQKMIANRKLAHLSSIFLGVLFAGAVGTAGASTLVPQTAVPGSCIPQFQVSMPVFGPAGPIPRVDAQEHMLLTVKMKEIEQTVLPQGTFFCTELGQNVTFGKTRVWTYEISDSITQKILGPANWPAVTIETKRFKPTVVKYDNQLPKFGDPIYINNQATTGLVQGLVTVDQTIHWADPDKLGCMMRMPPVDCTQTPGDPCCQPFSGAPPAVAHLHGGEVPSAYDGGPEAWFTPDGKTGADYNSLYNAGPGKAVYVYQNSQEPGTPWFHDHALGATRTNVYSGMAAFYFIREPENEPKKLPSGPYEIEMAIQDRQFDTNGQLFFPDGSGDTASNLNGPPPNPDIHPFWIPEFIGDVAIVNGAPWPFLNVEPRRYRLRLLDGSNARMYNLKFGNINSGTSAPVYQIGADDAYLNSPVPVNTVFIAPGERADVIVDFSGLAGKTVTVTNDAPVPFPSGLVPGIDQPTMANIMQFKVSNPQVPPNDNSCNPAVAGQCIRPKPIVRLADGQGNVAKGVKIDKIRQLVLKEVEGPGGPIEVLVNNTKWDGLNSPSIAEQFPVDGVSELPREGSIELWEIINLTMDAHPMHTHLTQFQILNRQVFDQDGTLGKGSYLATYNAAFGTGPVPLPTGCSFGQYCPGYGPPLPYKTPNTDGALGGNPAVSSFLVGSTTPPAPEESGWKDTAKSQPGQVLRILVRWNPTSAPLVPLKSFTGTNLYPFDPTKGPGYVWHCHIIDHEDNEMMRPYKVLK
jgi:spore coat protein A